MIRSAELQCDWDNWSAIGPDTLELHGPLGNFCNMNGAIRVAQSLLPGVRRVLTTVGGVRETEYTRTGQTWMARVPRRDA